MSHMEKSVAFLRVKELCLSRLEEPTSEGMLTLQGPGLTPTPNAHIDAPH